MKRPNQVASVLLSAKHRCALCGGHLDPGRGRVARKYHPDCKRVRNGLDAVERSLADVEFSDAADAQETARQLRSQLLRMANRVPTFQERTKDGRFR